MPLTVKVAGAWKHTRAGVRISGAWKDVPQVYVNVGGTWKALYSFAWETGNWSACSAECGGGTQTRTVRCRRSDGQYYDDAVCGRFAGEKPALTQPCNTQACDGCRYDINGTYVRTNLTSMGGVGISPMLIQISMFEDGSLIYTGYVQGSIPAGWSASVNGCTYSIGDCISCPGTVGANDLYKLCKSC